MVDWGLYFSNLGLVFNVKCFITSPISFVFYVAHEECKFMSAVLWQVDLISQRFGLPMYWSLYFPNLGLVFTIKCSITVQLTLYFMWLMRNVNTCLQ